MLTVETIRKIRLSIHRDGKSIRQTAKELRVSRNTVRTGDRRALAVLNAKTDKVQRPIVPPQTDSNVSSALLRLKITVNAIPMINDSRTSNPLA